MGIINYVNDIASWTGVTWMVSGRPGGVVLCTVWWFGLYNDVHVPRVRASYRCSGTTIVCGAPWVGARVIEDDASLVVVASSSSSSIRSNGV